MNEANGLNEIVFTSAAVLDLLLKIDELKDYTVGLTETLNGELQLQIGDSIYLIDPNNSTTIRVEDEIVGEIEIQTEEAYNEISEDIACEFDEPQFLDSEISNDDIIEGGIIKEIAKSLTLGGLIRFTAKHLLK